MIKLTAILFALFSVLSVVGCAEQPNANTQDQQRAHAEKAQSEMSSDIKK